MDAKEIAETIIEMAETAGADALSVAQDARETGRRKHCDGLTPND